MVNKNNILEEKLTPKDRLKEILSPEDFKDYERMVEESNNKISWEKLEEYSEFDENSNLKGIYWIDDLILYSTSITSLGKFEEVWGNLFLCETPIESLGNLKYVWGNLELILISITSLGNLKEVWGSLNLGQTPITSLGNLKEVWGFLILRWISRKNIINIRKEIRNKKIHIWNKIIYYWEGIYEEFSIFFNYLWEFNDDSNLDNSEIEEEKQEFIEKYWYGSAKRSDSVKKDLNLTANILYYFFVDNFIKEWDKIKKRIKKLKKSNKDEERIKKEKLNLKLALYNKLEEKFNEINNYFWRDIKKRLEDEFEKEMEGYGNHK